MPQMTFFLFLYVKNSNTNKSWNNCIFNTKIYSCVIRNIFIFHTREIIINFPQQNSFFFEKLDEYYNFLIFAVFLSMFFVHISRVTSKIRFREYKLSRITKKSAKPLKHSTSKVVEADKCNTAICNNMFFYHKNTLHKNIYADIRWKYFHKKKKIWYSSLTTNDAQEQSNQFKRKKLRYRG